MILEEIKFYEYGQSKIHKNKSTYTEIYNDKKTEMVMRRNTDNKGNFIGYHSNWVLNGLESKSGKLIFGNGGAENILPLVLDIEQYGNWTSHFRWVKITKKINKSRILIESVIDMPFPLAARHSHMYF